jgi:hypothetical protein
VKEFLMHRVELKGVFVKCLYYVFTEFLMHRVELKAGICKANIH